MPHRYVIEEIGNGWLLKKGEQSPFYYPSLDMCLKALEPNIQMETVRKPTEFRKGGSQIDIEDILTQGEEAG